MNRAVGLLVIVGGAFLVVAGVLVYSGALNWFGRLPGDIRYEGEHTRVYVPIVSMLDRAQSDTLPRTPVFVGSLTSALKFA
jgi:hypothetical protein